ncbi:oligosaccharide flippase family protein [Brucella pseudogrignonensis]|uniref:O-antigen/teichoic acid export membrane protein n=1 Tax=Brucella pseudogrignonensis TaxID=419475 RepID=A0ABU1MAE3_9HYPH|nr:oligosaccharide flippase family protein [Brucella pseudogrignonensis]MDR6433007.1 O-antigen/teichoic acid export membrane protein [Brucella pseudogrignonensis]
MSGNRRGIVMAALEQYAGLLFNFLTVIAVSRFLGPAETGAGVVGLSIGAIIFSLREFASPEFLIRIDKVQDYDIRTSMTFLMIVTLVLSAGLYLAREYFAVAYHDPTLLLFLDITIIAALVESLSLPVVALLRREMAFGTLARIRTAGTGFGAAVTIAMAGLGFGHMCFAFGLLASALITTGMAIAIYPLARLLRPSLASINTAWRFGIYLGGNAGLNKICETFPQLMLGRFMPIASVGIYNRANTVSGLPDRIFLSAVFTVAFPMLSAHVREGGDISRAYIRALSYISVVYWPAQALLALLAYPLVNIILGPGWTEAALIVSITSLASLFWFPVILTYPLLMALGANREAFISNLISRLVATTILCFAALHGLLAVALSQFISLPFQMVVAIIYVRKHTKFSYSILGSELLKSALVTILALSGPLVMVAMDGFNLDMHWSKALLMGLVAIASWFAALFVTRHPFTEELVPVLRWLLGRFMGRLRWARHVHEPAE